MTRLESNSLTRVRAIFSTSLSFWWSIPVCLHAKKWAFLLQCWSMLAPWAQFWCKMWGNSPLWNQGGHRCEFKRDKIRPWCLVQGQLLKKWWQRNNRTHGHFNTQILLLAVYAVFHKLCRLIVRVFGVWYSLEIVCPRFNNLWTTIYSTRVGSITSFQFNYNYNYAFKFVNYITITIVLC